MTNDAIIIAVDLGGTLVRAAAYTANAEQLARAQRPTPAGGTGDEVLQAIVDTVREVWVGQGRAIGVGAPGRF